MAGRTTNIIEALNHKVVKIFGSFLPQGASAPLPNPLWAGSAAAGIWGQGIASIVFTATGVWTAVLSDSWYRVLGLGADCRMADGAAIANPNNCCLQNVNVTGGVVNSIPAKTVTITNTVTSSGALGNIAAGTNQLVYFYLDVQNSSVQ